MCCDVKKLIQILTIFSVLIIFLFGVAIHLQAQVVRSIPIDVSSRLEEGSVQATVNPDLTINTIDKVFDGNPYTEGGVQEDTLASITLQFDRPVNLTKSKVFFWNNGKWRLEAADSLSHLENQTESYQLIVDQRMHSAFTWDSVEFEAVYAPVFRLTGKNLNEGIHFGEWEIGASVTFTSLSIDPHPIKLVPNTSLQLDVQLVDEHGNYYPYSLDEVVHWSSSDRSIVSVTEMGEAQAQALGSATIYAQTTSLAGSTNVTVVSDFRSENAETLEIKVALVIQDQIIDSTNMKTIHEVRGWTDPMELINQIQEDFQRASEGVVQFKIVETHNDQISFTRLDGELMSIDTLRYFYSSTSRLYGRNQEGTLQNLAEKQNKVRFDYNEMIDYYEFDTKRNTGQINEVWVYAPPFGGMYESQLVGPGAFWWNSPSLEHPGLEKLLSVMGWNYERGVAEALHSFGHRVESAMTHAYGRWECTNPNPNSWELFTRIDKDVPEGAHVGNVHFLPNGTSDYDYSNTRFVKSYADNWKRYPILLDQSREMNCSEWGCNQRRYMVWWLRHMPRYKGVKNGILNNWWHYVVDYENAVELADQMTAVKGKEENTNHFPDEYKLNQNYPNPFNNTTQITFAIPSKEKITLTIYDMLGRKVKTLIDNKKKSAGRHAVTFTAENISSGLYFYLLSSETFYQTRKMMLIK